MHDHELLVRGALDRLNANDIEGYVDCFNDDLVSTSRLAVARGKAEFSDHLASLSALSSHYRRVERLLVSGDDVVVWLTFGGTVAATGRAFEDEVCTIFTVDDGKLAAVTEYGELASAREAFQAAP